tara:strand:- start:93 stop:422 length:330 start_codon:yes stop_codon:yes gene_type:complete
MRTSEDIRRENAKYILETQFQGVKNRMASAVGVPHMQIARLFFDTENRRKCGDKLARKIEEALGLERGWIDQDHAKTDMIMTKIATLNQEQRRAVESVVDAMIMKYKSD